MQHHDYVHVGARVVGSGEADEAGDEGIRGEAKEGIAERQEANGAAACASFRRALPSHIENCEGGQTEEPARHNVAQAGGKGGGSDERILRRGAEARGEAADAMESRQSEALQVHQGLQAAATAAALESVACSKRATAMMMLLWLVATKVMTHGTTVLATAAVLCC